jgi:hypothetical protein
MSNLICKENFNWKKYVDRYKDLKNIDNIDTAWNHWCEQGRKQGRKFFTLAPFKNNKYYIITKEYIKQKNLKLKKNRNSIVISNLDDDIVIEDYVSNIKQKLKKLNKNKTFVCQTINKNFDDKLNNKEEINKLNNKEENIKLNNKEENIKLNNKKEINKLNNKEENIKLNNKKENNKLNNEDKHDKKNDDIEILEKDFKYTDYKKNNVDEWTQKTENSEIFFIDFENETEDSDESIKYFNKKNQLNLFSNSS